MTTNASGSNPFESFPIGDTDASRAQRVGTGSIQDGQMTISLGFFPLGFFLFFCTPVVDINGRATKYSWGTHTFSLRPGRYKVGVYFRYLWMKKCGSNWVEFDLADGESKNVSYYMWPWMFARGKMSVR